MASLNRVNIGDGDGDGDGSGDGDGYGSGDGSGYGDGYGSGDGDGDGFVKERKEIELNILKNIPDIDLPLYMNIWEFEVSKEAYWARLSSLKL